MPCDHDKPEGRTQCNACQAAYMRAYRPVAKLRDMVRYKKQGAEELRVMILSRLEGDLAAFELNGAAAAELIRWIGLD